MKTFSALLALRAGTSPVTGEFSAQRPMTRSFDIFFDLCLNKRLRKQSRRWWFETQTRSFWRHSNETYFGGLAQAAVAPLLTHWSYHSLALSHRFIMCKISLKCLPALKWWRLQKVILNKEHLNCGMMTSWNDLLSILPALCEGKVTN